VQLGRLARWPWWLTANWQGSTNRTRAARAQTRIAWELLDYYFYDYGSHPRRRGVILNASLGSGSNLLKRHMTPAGGVTGNIAVTGLVLFSNTKDVGVTTLASEFLCTNDVQPKGA
tara:strand:- start:1408 stop:1755 length:348 start_codon:yes stop_codon:yes gene_type:complete